MLHNLGLCSALAAFELGGIFIVLHLLWHRASVLTVSSEDLLVFYNKQGVLRTWSNLDPHRGHNQYYKWICFLCMIRRHCRRVQSLPLRAVQPWIFVDLFVKVTLHESSEPPSPSCSATSRCLPIRPLSPGKLPTSPAHSGIKVSEMNFMPSRLYNESICL